MNRAAVIFLCLSSFVGASACQRDEKHAPPSPPAPLPSGIAARIGTQTITLAELDEKVAADIFELRSSVLRILLVEKLIKQEAEKRKVTGLELRKLEVEDKVPMPSEAEATQAVQQWVESGKLTAAEASAVTPEQAARRLREHRMREREEQYYDELTRKAAVQIDFRALGKPNLKITEDGPRMGPPSAPIKIVEFADLAKTFTTTWQPTLEQLVEKYGKDVSFLFKQKPGEAGTAGAKLAEAALCAHAQGRYWDYRRALIAKPETNRVEAIVETAKAAKLDVPAFEGCLASGKTREAVARDQGEVVANRLDGDPVVSINGIILTGAQAFPDVDRLLRIEMTGSP